MVDVIGKYFLPCRKVKVVYMTLLKVFLENACSYVQRNLISIKKAYDNKLAFQRWNNVLCDKLIDP